MPKNRWHQLPMGAMHRFKEYRYEDIVPMTLIKKMLQSDQDKLCNRYNTGRKPKLTAQRINAKIVRSLWKCAIDRMMQGERLVLTDDISFYIGRVPKDRNYIYNKNDKKNYLRNINTHGIILNGFFHNYYFRMPQRRRTELRNRIKKGQTFL